MARMGVFSRNDTTPEHISRSLQMLTHRKSFTAKYMEIYPNFCEVLQPTESIRIRTTNFIRTIPMKTPQLSRVRAVQRFYAVPFRIMWRPWEDWIKGTEDAAFMFDLPYVCNQFLTVTTASKRIGDGIGVLPNSASVDFEAGNAPRVIYLNDNGRAPATRDADLPYDWNVERQHEKGVAAALFAPRELGDYLGYPLGVLMGKFRDSENKTKFLVPHAFKMCAYQMCYSYGYRQPNVQTRVDDFFEMWKNQRDVALERLNNTGVSAETQSYEYPPVIICADRQQSFKPVPRPNRTYTNTRWSNSIINHAQEVVDDNGESVSALVRSSDKSSVIATSWDNVETFPLKAGANLSLQASYINSDGESVTMPSNIAIFRMRYANWQTDYFTSSNPWQQRGDEAQIPVVGDISVDLSGITATFTGVASRNRLLFDNNGNDEYVGWVDRATFTPTPQTGDDYTVVMTDNDKAFLVAQTSDFSGQAGQLYTRSTPAGTVSLSVGAQPSVTGLYVSPSSFRFAMALQHIKELTAQTDNRYKSYMSKIFGSKIADNRIDRPEFLGGSVQEINVTDVVQTSESTDSSPLGSLAGRGTSAKTSRTMHFFAKEHTVVIGLLHIIPDTEYLTGLLREDNAHDRFDFPLPQFARLSEQPVYGYELSAQGFAGVNSLSSPGNADFTVFGYEPVYNDFRWRKNSAHGDFRDVFNQFGNYEWYKPWLITRDFGYKIKEVSGQGVGVYHNQPYLNDKFLSGRYGVDYSNFTVVDPKIMYPFIVDSYHELRWTRIIPTRGLPSKLG